MTRRLEVAAAVLCAAALAGPAPAEEPSAEEIVARHVRALGGREAVAALRNLVMKGTYAYNGLEFPVLVYHAREARRREEIAGLSRWGDRVLEGVTVVRAVDGRQAWTSGDAESPAPRLVGPEETLDAVASADFDGPLLDAAAKGHTLTLVGRVELEGQPCWQLRVARGSGASEELFLGTDDYLVKRREVAPPRPADLRRELQKPRVLHFDDYRPVAGVRVPFFVQVDEALFSRQYTLLSIEANRELADELFTPPPGVLPAATDR